MTSRRLLDVLLAAALVLAGTPTLIRVVGDHGRAWLVAGASLVPLALPPLLVLAVLELLLGHRLLAAVAAGVLLTNAVWLAPLFVAAPVPDGTPLTVMTVNLRFGRTDATALVRGVRDGRVDVLATQELTGEAVDRLRAAGLEALLPFHELDPAPGADGGGLWSRYPVRSLPGWELRYRSPGAVVRSPGGEVVVRVLHPSPPSLQDGGRLYRRDYADLRRLVDALDLDRPTVLVGDLNASRDHGLLRQLMGDRFRDTAEVSGEGVLRTWGPRVGGFALLHLDHVLVDRSLGVRATRVLPLEGSDHRAVVAQIVQRARGHEGRAAGTG